jgi:tellurite resistance protein
VPPAPAPQGLSLPITLFSIPLGLAGLGGAWVAAAAVLDAPALVGDLAYGASALVFCAFLVAYVIGTARHGPGRFHLDLRHPLTGPLTAYIPVIAMLLVPHYTSGLGSLGRWLTYLALTALLLNAAQLMAHWLKAPLDQDAVHPGYFLPVTAGPFIASIGLMSVHDSMAAVAMFGVGVYFWMLFGAVISARLFYGAPLPEQFRPVLSILLSPPGTASLAWFAITNGHIDGVQAAITGVTLFMLLVQLFFVGDYVRLPFTTQHWVFTFPLAVLGAIAVRWAAGWPGSDWRVVAWIVLTVTTVLILSVAALTARNAGRLITRLAQRRLTS